MAVGAIDDGLTVGEKLATVDGGEDFKEGCLEDEVVLGNEVKVFVGQVGIVVDLMDGAEVEGMNAKTRT